MRRNYATEVVTRGVNYTTAGSDTPIGWRLLQQTVFFGEAG